MSEPGMMTEQIPLILAREAARSAGGPRVVSFGGGHGLYAALRAFRLVTDELTAVVTVADDGGSSGRLRAEFGGLPPGDLRMALAALCDDDEWGRNWRNVIQHRFSSSGALDEHAVGNLLLTALWQQLGDHVAGLDWMARLLKAHGRVLPMSSVPLDIEAEVTLPGQNRPVLIRGQSRVAATAGAVHRVRLVPVAPAARPETLEAIRRAEVLNFGPGSWYTSVMPHLLVPEVAAAVHSSRAVKSLTLNLPGATGETVGMGLGEHLATLAAHDRGMRFDYVVVDSAAAAEEPGLAARAHELFGARLWASQIASRKPHVHDSLRLASCYRDMLHDAGIQTEDG